MEPIHPVTHHTLPTAASTTFDTTKGPSSFSKLLFEWEIRSLVCSLNMLKYLTRVALRTASGSHQSVMNSLLTEQSSSRGLTVKVYGRDSESGRLFPGGYHFHKRRNFMKEIIRGDRSPYIFHMSWTENKANKQKFYQQLGEWHLQERCTSKPVIDFKMDGCCSAKPLYKCHYRDKPSKESCKSSNPIDKNGRSFW